MHRVVFICSGNICRSPMAERLFLAAAQTRGAPAVAVSMGTLGLRARRADPHAIDALAEIGLDVSDHRSQPLSVGILRNATSVLAMERMHIDEVLRRDPMLRARTHLLGSFDDAETPEIADPVGGALDDFRVCRDRLARAVDAFLEAHATP